MLVATAYRLWRAEHQQDVDAWYVRNENAQVDPWVTRPFVAMAEAVAGSEERAAQARWEGRQ